MWGKVEDYRVEWIWGGCVSAKDISFADHDARQEPGAPNAVRSREADEFNRRLNITHVPLQATPVEKSPHCCPLFLSTLPPHAGA